MFKNPTNHGDQITDEMFRHESGVWNITAIRKQIDREPAVYGPIEIPLTIEFIHYCKTKIGFDIKRVRALTSEQADEPGIVIYSQSGGNVTITMIDGHHRAVAQSRRQRKNMSVFVLSEEIAEAWRIKDAAVELTANFFSGKPLT